MHHTSIYSFLFNQLCVLLADLVIALSSLGLGSLGSAEETQLVAPPSKHFAEAALAYVAMLGKLPLLNIKWVGWAGSGGLRCRKNESCLCAALRLLWAAIRRPNARGCRLPGGRPRGISRHVPPSRHVPHVLPSQPAPHLRRGKSSAKMAASQCIITWIIT